MSWGRQHTARSSQGKVESDNEDRRYYADLCATVHRGAPPDLLEELPELYSSCFSVTEYFDLFDHPTRVGMCELDSPRHVLPFQISGSTVDVLNKVIDIEPDSVVRACTAIFRAFPCVTRIRAEVKFPPAELRRPLRVRLRADDLVVHQPTTVDDYRKMLGKRTRQNLNQYMNRLHRAHPDFRMSTLEGEMISRELLEQVNHWNCIRLRAKGELSSYEAKPERLDPLFGLLRVYGVAICGHIGESLAGATLGLHVGSDMWAYMSGFDTQYEDLHLGLIMVHAVICESIRRDCVRTHLLWGTPVYKKRLGAVPVPAYRVSFFRSSLHRTLFTCDELSKQDMANAYWRARGRTKKAVMRLARTTPAT